MTSHEARLSGWDVLLNAHLWISKPDDPLIASLAGLDHKLLRAIGSPLRIVTGHLGFIYHPQISLTLDLEYFRLLRVPFSSAVR